MTSFNNIRTIIEPAVIAVLVGLMGSLIFSFCQYFNERRRRREFRNSWSTKVLENQTAASPAAPSVWNWVAAWFPGKAARAEVAPFPSFVSYYSHHLGRYGFAILSVTLVLVIRCLLEPALEGSLPFSFFLAAVLVTARTQGIWETLLALVLGFVLGSWFFAQPKSLGISAQQDWWAAGLYFTVGLGIVWFLKSEQTAWLRTLTSGLSVLRAFKQKKKEKSPSPRDLLASMVEWAQDPILSLTPEGRIMTWNVAAEKRFGWSAQEAIGQPLTTLLPPTRQAELRQLTEQVGRGEPLKPWSISVNAKCGQPVEALITISPVRESSGRLLGVSLIVRNSP